MRSMLVAGAAALALFLAGCGGGDGNDQAALPDTPLKQIAAPNGGDWTQTVTETPDGGYRMGNPNAPVKLVEFASITCPHCGEFAEAGTAPLRDKYVKSGQVSWEYRPFMIFPTDPGVFQLLRCQGAQPFFTAIEQLYADQHNWAGRLQSLTQDQAQQIQSLPPTARSRAFVQAVGLEDFFRQRGMPQARIESCLADTSGLDRLTEITRKAGDEHEITGTPTFMINGEVSRDIGTPPFWPQLERELRRAIS
jgi:protein-disulfide isomerase